MHSILSICSYSFVIFKYDMLQLYVVHDKLSFSDVLLATTNVQFKRILQFNVNKCYFIYCIKIVYYKLKLYSLFLLQPNNDWNMFGLRRITLNE